MLAVSVFRKQDGWRKFPEPAPGWRLGFREPAVKHTVSLAQLPAVARVANYIGDTDCVLDTRLVRLVPERRSVADS